MATISLHLSIAAWLNAKRFLGLSPAFTGDLCRGSGALALALRSASVPSLAQRKARAARVRGPSVQCSDWTLLRSLQPSTISFFFSPQYIYSN